jgi:hypothetical protein
MLFLGTVTDLQLSISDSPACDKEMRYMENKDIVLCN